MIELKSIEGILFLQYLTGYNIKDISAAYKLGSIELFIEEYSKFKFQQNTILTQGFIDEKLKDTFAAIDKMKYFGINAIPFYSENFPPQLRKIKTCPPLLFSKGHLPIESKLCAIVGSRVTSKYAEESINIIVEFLKSKNFGIVSGLALGIDTLAHNAAIKHSAYTIAVLPNSLDTIYPKENYGLANKILDSGGTLLSELPFGINRGRKSFVERNRIQSGLSGIVIPIEMGINSGTMHTVEFCLSQGKKLALPVPNNELLNTSEYEGIRHLLIKGKQEPSSNISFFTNTSGLEEILNNINIQGELF